MKRTAGVMNALGAAAILELSVVLGSGRGGNWALPAFIAFEATVLTLGLVFGLRAQRTPSRDLPGSAGN
jgi:hypothetical protein